MIIMIIMIEDGNFDYHDHDYHESIPLIIIYDGDD